MTAGEPTARMAAWLEHAWLENYLGRALSTEESAWFEAYVLDKAELLDMIEADTLLRDGMASQPIDRSDAVASFARAAEGEQGPGRADVAMLGSSSSERDARNRRLHKPYWAIAASLIVGLGVGALTGVSQQWGSRDSDVVANPTRIVFDTMRGEAVAPQVEHGDSSAQYVLLEAAVPDGATDVVVLLGSHKPIVLQPSPDGFVSVLISKSVLAKASIQTVLQYGLNGEVVRRTLAIPLDGENAR